MFRLARFLAHVRFINKLAVSFPLYVFVFCLNLSFANKTRTEEKARGRVPSRLRSLSGTFPDSLAWLSAGPGPLPVGHSTGLPPSKAAPSPRASDPEASVREHTQDERQSFYDLISEVPLHHFGCSLFIRNEAESPATLEETGLPRGMSLPHKVRIPGVHL